MRTKKCVLKSDKHKAGIFRKDVVSVALKWEEAEQSGACLRRDVDFPGGDIKRVQNVLSHFRCATICKFTKSCTRIVWVPHNRLCILKNKDHGPATRQSLIANREAVSLSLECRQERRKSNKESKEKTVSKFIDLDRQDIQFSTTYPAGLLATIKSVSKLSECKKACSKNDDCILIVANVKLKRCFLRNENHGKAKKLKGFVSVTVRKRKPKKLVMKFIDIDPKKLQMNVAYSDGTISTVDDARTLSQCVEACSKNKNCVLVVANVRMKRCFLRDAGHGKSKKKNGFVSVVLRPKKSDSKSNGSENDKQTNRFIDINRDEIQMDTTYSGGLISNIPKASSLSECRKACLETKGCVRVVANVKMRRCFLKNKESVKAKKKKKGFVSIVIKAKKDSEDN